MLFRSGDTIRILARKADTEVKLINDKVETHLIETGGKKGMCSSCCIVFTGYVTETAC